MLWCDLRYYALQVCHTLETTRTETIGRRRRGLLSHTGSSTSGSDVCSPSRKKSDGELGRISDDAFGTALSKVTDPLKSESFPQFSTEIPLCLIIAVVYAVRGLQAGRNYFHRRATRPRRHLNGCRCATQADDDRHHSEPRSVRRARTKRRLRIAVGRTGGQQQWEIIASGPPVPGYRAHTNYTRNIYAL